MPLKVMSCSYGGNSVLVEEMRPMIEELGMQLVTIHEHSNASIKWEVETWRQHLSQADIIVVPANYEKQPAKSANRVTQAMALGKPVICSPLQSYLDVDEDHPGIILVARTKEEWREHLLRLRDDENFRTEISKKALEAAKGYSIDAIGAKWVNTLFEKKEPIDIIIATYNNAEYLKLCLNSIMRNTDIDYNVILSDAGSDAKMWLFLEKLNKENYSFPHFKGLKILGEKNKRKNYSETCNAGILNSSSEHFVILNSDVIVSKGWLENILKKMKSDKSIAACGVLSNCDKGWLFQ